MSEFFGFGGYSRVPEGSYSWQHLTFVTTLVLIMIALAVFLGRKNRNASDKAKNRVLLWAALAIDGFELFKIVLLCFRSGDPLDWLYNLPLFLCSIQLIAIPMAAFAKGTVREAALDFVGVFGILGAILGTIGAGNNYGTYPVLCFDNVVSAITHCISGFASLYVLISGMAGMKKSNIRMTLAILLSFCVAAYAANWLLDYNYKFLMRGDGTPYDILYNLVGGSPVLYPICVVVLFLVYVCGFYQVYYFAHKKKATL